MLDEWSTKEKLALASAVVRSGDQNWMMVSRLVRPFANASRPLDWFSQSNCARQYSELLKLEGPRRKRGDGEGENNPGDIIVRKLTTQRIEELKKIISEQAEKYRTISKDLEDVKAGKYDGQMKDKWSKLQAQKKEEAELIAQKLKSENEAREKVKQVLSKTDRLNRSNSIDNQAQKKDFKVDTLTNLTSNLEIPKDNSNLIESPFQTEVESSKSPQATEVEKNLFNFENKNDLQNSKNNIQSPKVIQNAINDQIDDIDKSDFKNFKNTPEDHDKIIVDGSQVDKNLNEKKISPLKISSINLNLPILIKNSPIKISSQISNEETSPNKHLKNINEAAKNASIENKLSPLKISEKLVVTPTKLSPIKISRDLLSPIGSGGAFKIFQKELSDTQDTRDESLNELNNKNNDVGASMEEKGLQQEERQKINVEDDIIEGDKFFNDKTLIKNDEQNFKYEKAESSEKNMNIEISFENVNEDIKPDIIDDESKSKTEFLSSNSNKSFFEYENANVNMKLKFDLNESLPGSPASISNSDTEDERLHKTWKKSIMLVWRAIANHKFANVFMHPVTEDIAPGYHSIVLRPMDLITIRKNIDIGVIRSTSEFQRDVMLMFINAMMYNNVNQYVHQMAKTMFQDAMAQIEQFVSTQMMVPSEPKLLRTLRRSDIGEKGDEDGRKRRAMESEISAKKKKVPTATLR